MTTLTRRRLGLLLGATVAACVIAELGFRLVETRLGVDRARIGLLRDYLVMETADYEPRAYVGYADRRGAPGVNAWGFLDEEHDRAHPPGVIRIACLGSSTTESGNAANYRGSYPFFLQRELEARWQRPVEVLNFGVSSWTTAEVLVNYVLTVQDFTPDVVLLHEIVNDAEPRAWPHFSRDYSHYRHPWTAPRYVWPLRTIIGWSDLAAFLDLRRTSNAGLERLVTTDPHGQWVFPHGQFAPGTIEPFIRNTRTITEHATAHGAQVLLVTMPYDHDRVSAPYMQTLHRGLEEHNQVYRDLAQQEGYGLADLDVDERAHPAELTGAFVDLVHVQPAGNQWKARRIAAQLTTPR
jgi:lysophospholipase L1-like esterase